MTTTLIIIFIVSIIAFSISAICGGGAGLMLIPILVCYQIVQASAVNLPPFNSILISFITKFKSCLLSSMSYTSRDAFYPVSSQYQQRNNNSYFMIV